MYHSSFHINQAKRSKFAYLTTVIVAFLMTACGNAETNKTTSVEKNSSVTNTQNDTKIQQSLAKNESLHTSFKLLKNPQLLINFR